MRRLLAPLMIGALLALAAPAGAQTKPSCAGADTPVTEDPGVAKAAVQCIVNAERSARGLLTVAFDGRLDSASLGHSQDMAGREYFDHTSPEGRTPADRADAAGYPYVSLYENIAVGQTSARIVMEGWMRSEAHCHGILAPEVIHLGLGLVPALLPGPDVDADVRPRPGPARALDHTAPSAGCPYQTLSIAPGPARVTLLALGRRGRRITVDGVLVDQGGGRDIVVTVRRNGRRARKTIRTRPDGTFRTTIRAPKGRGAVRVTARAPAVPDVYEEGSDTRRV